jgi:hypothetical protein
MGALEPPNEAAPSGLASALTLTTRPHTPGQYETAKKTAEISSSSSGPSSSASAGP